MLTKPDCGWTDFKLDGTNIYGLSYLDDIAFEWLDQCIHGLETMNPFCVKGFLEPNRFICVVSYWNCHIIVEDDDRAPLKKEEITFECSHTSMIDFCRYLHDDIASDIDGWAGFVSYFHDDREEKKKALVQRLERLSELISEKQKFWLKNRCFL